MSRSGPVMSAVTSSLAASSRRYRRVLAIGPARSVLLLGMVLRVPMFAGLVLLTVHVVQSLGRSYTEAGLVGAVATVAIAVSGPWRGRLLDRLGLRRVVLPCVVVTAACWAVAPFSSYWVLLVLAGLAGLFVVPSFSIIRTSVIAQVPEEDRRTALSLDSVLVELAFIAGPLLGVWASQYWPTSWLLFAIEMFAAAAGLALWAVDPPLRSAAEDQAAAARAPRVREWFTVPVLVVFAAAGSVTLVLSGTDLAMVAAMREFAAYEHLGQVLAVWGLGSLLGGLVYGGLSRPVPAAVLLGGLAATTVPLAFAPGPWELAVLAFVSGLFCAPSITATVDQVSVAVPAAARAEAMGWHGSFMTAGSALGAPVAGLAIDRTGSGGGFVAVGVVGVLAGLTCAAVVRRMPVPAAGPGAAGPGAAGQEAAVGEPAGGRV